MPSAYPLKVQFFEKSAVSKLFCCKSQPSSVKPNSYRIGLKSASRELFLLGGAWMLQSARFWHPANSGARHPNYNTLIQRSRTDQEECQDRLLLYCTKQSQNNFSSKYANLMHRFRTISIPVADFGILWARYCTFWYVPELYRYTSSRPSDRFQISHILSDVQECQTRCLGHVTSK